MDFFGRQDQARRNTALLVVLYGAAVALITLAVYLLVAAFTLPEGGSLWNPEIMVVSLVGMLVLVGGGSLFRMASISTGESVARMMGADPLEEQPVDAAERMLRNVVEEMSIAAGVPVPGIWVMRGERGINAFAAGHGPEDAVVAVTRGALDRLTRDEIQGVVAHEFSHIIHRDVRLNLRMLGILYGILMISLLGRGMLRVASFGGGGRRRSRGKGDGGGLALVALGLGLWVIGSIGVLFSRLIKQAVARQREFLADAAAVQFTRNPGGLSGALKKIAATSLGSSIVSPHAEEVGHMFFSDGAARLGGLLATHPPLRDRILRLDPSWDGSLPDLTRPGAYNQEPAQPPPLPSRPPPFPFPIPGLPGPVPGGLPGPVGAVMPSPALLALIASIGQPGARNLEAAEQILAQVPSSLREAARHPAGARLIILGLTADPAQQDEVRVQALGLDPEDRDRYLRIRPDLASLPSAARLPLADLCLPALRKLDEDRMNAFLLELDRAVHADQEVDLLEFVLLRMVQRQIQLARNPEARPLARIYGWPGLAQPASVVLSALAWYGARPESAEASFQAARRVLGDHVHDVRFLPVENCGLEQVHAALHALDGASTKLKRQLLGALATAAGADGVVTVEQAELFRAVADALGVPVPLLPAAPAPA